MKKANGITAEKNSSARSVAQSRKTLFLGFGELPPNKQNGKSRRKRDFLFFAFCTHKGTACKRMIN